MSHSLKILLVCSLALAGCENARPAEEREAAAPTTTDTTGTTGAMQQQAVQNATQGAAAPGPGPGH